ncbi:MAG: hypothetical protein JW940_19210 [Polyangiaceae bacterium]|nr:hypothetical protein [Polyangiaceae bacterium]
MKHLLTWSLLGVLAGCSSEGTPTVPSSDATRDCTLRGKVLLGGKAPVGWKAQIGFSAETGFEGEEAVIDQDGRFTLRTPRPGRYGLSMSSPESGNGMHRTFYRWLELRSGPNDWTLDVPVGTVVVSGLQTLPTLRGISEGPGDPKQGYSLAWKGGDGTWWSAEIMVHTGQPWTVERVPAGEIVLSRITPQNYHLEACEREPLTRFTLKGHETRKLDLGE